MGCVVRFIYSVLEISMEINHTAALCYKNEKK